MSEPFIGQIQTFGFNFAPRGWAKCDGQILSIATNSALFSLLGTTYGGDGRTTFALPDLRSRVALHQGTGPGLSPRTIGQRAGAENVTLSLNQIPSHNHTATDPAADLQGTANPPNTSDPTGAALALAPAYNNTSVPPTVDMAAGSVDHPPHDTDNAGGSQSHANVQPSLVLNVCIALVGIFPSRN